MQNNGPGFKVPEVVSTRFDVNQEIGSGAYGLVYKATDKLTGETVALKRCMKVLSNKTDAHRTLREVCILRELGKARHPNLVQLKMAIKASEKDKDLYLAFQFCDGDLRKAIQNSIIHERNDILRCLSQIASGLAHLQQRGILHRDMKPENVLVSLPEGGMPSVCIGDLGLARCESSVEDRLDPDDFENSAGTLPYMPIEILLDLDKHTYASDVWALGVIFGEMLAHGPFIHGRKKVQVIRSILTAIGEPTEAYMEQLEADEQLPACIQIEHAIEDIPHDAGSPERLENMFPAAAPEDFDLLLSMMKMEVEQRITAAEVMRHPLLKPYVEAEQEGNMVLAQSWEPLVVPLDTENEDSTSLTEIVTTLEQQLREYQVEQKQGGCGCVLA